MSRQCSTNQERRRRGGQAFEAAQPAPATGAADDGATAVAGEQEVEEPARVGRAEEDDGGGRQGCRGESGS